MQVPKWCITWCIPGQNILCHQCCMSKNDPQFNLRMPPHLDRKVRAAAAKNRRSVTAEINSRLESTFEKAAPTPEDTVREIIDRATSLLRHFGNTDRR